VIGGQRRRSQSSVAVAPTEDQVRLEERLAFQKHLCNNSEVPATTKSGTQ
jgi:hypothetical protein